jgi:hemerythrin-like metal-binding protein
MLKWSDEFATGFVQVDTQHRVLIDKINLLETLLSGPPPTKAACDDLINFLEHYVDRHFTLEEQCMEQVRCPVHARNKQAHAAFLTVFEKFKTRYGAEGPKPELLRSLQTTASDWIKNHILTVDTQLKTCLKDGAPAPA